MHQKKIKKKMLLRLKWIAPHHGYYGLVLIGLSYYYKLNVYFDKLTGVM